MSNSAEPFTPYSFQALVVLWPQAERRQDLSSLSIPILHPSGRNFCTSSKWTASRSSTAGGYVRLAFASGPLAPERGADFLELTLEFELLLDGTGSAAASFFSRTFLAKKRISSLNGFCP